MIVEGSEKDAVHWMQPTDYDLTNFIKSMQDEPGSPHPGFHQAVWCDGRVSAIGSGENTDENLRRMIRITDGATTPPPEN